jgi:hypothetical protein
MHSLYYCLLGRWLCHMRKAVSAFANITVAPKKPFEDTGRLVAHYPSEVVVAVAFVLLASGAGTFPTDLAACAVRNRQSPTLSGTISERAATLVRASRMHHAQARCRRSIACSTAAVSFCASTGLTR